MKKILIKLNFFIIFALFTWLSANAIVTAENIYGKKSHVFLRWDNMIGEDIKIDKIDINKMILNLDHVPKRVIYGSSRCVPVNYSRSKKMQIFGKFCQEMTMTLLNDELLSNNADLEFKIGNGGSKFRLNIFIDKILEDINTANSIMANLYLSRIEFIPFDKFSYLVATNYGKEIRHIRENLVQLPKFMSFDKLNYFNQVELKKEDHDTNTQIFLNNSIAQLSVIDQKYIIAVYSSIQNFYAFYEKYDEPLSVVTVKLMTVDQYKSQRDELIQKLLSSSRNLSSVQVEKEIADFMPRFPNYENVVGVSEVPSSSLSNYKESCVDILYTGKSTNILSASCLKSDQSYKYSSIKVDSCPNGVRAIDGELYCLQNAIPVQIICPFPYILDNECVLTTKKRKSELFKDDNFKNLKKPKY